MSFKDGCQQNKYLNKSEPKLKQDLVVFSTISTHIILSYKIMTHILNIKKSSNPKLGNPKTKVEL